MTKSNATSNAQEPLRVQLLTLIQGGEAHATFDEVVKNFPAELRGKVPDRLPYSAWQLLEHMRIAQRDILDFSAPPTGGYQPLEWPEAYWPKSTEPTSEQAWDRTIAAIRKDREHFESLIRKPETDLFKPFRWGNGQNLLRETLLIVDHTAYHIGELVVLRRLLGIWHK